MILRADDLLAHQIGQKLGIPMLITESFEINRAEIEGVDGRPKRWKIDRIRAILPVEHALFLHIKGDQTELADVRIAEMVRNMETRALVSIGCRAAESEFWGAKLTSTLTFRGGSLFTRWTGGSFLNCSKVAGWMDPALIDKVMGRSLAATAASESQ